MTSERYPTISAGTFLTLLFTAATATSAPPPPPRLPLFRPPNATELARAAAAGAAFAWSAHQSEDALLVVSDAQAASLACLLDDVGSDALELSWTVQDASSGVTKRHMLASVPSGQLQRQHEQTFGVDLGPGLQPAEGVFRQGGGSVLTVALRVPAPAPLNVGCELHVAGGAVVIRSARVRLWDERPAVAALAAGDGAELACRRARDVATTAAVNLDCDVPGGSAASLLLETAVYAVFAAPEGQRCGDDVSGRGLRTNSTDPAAFYAVYTGGRLRLGWTLEGDGAALQAHLDSGDTAVCVSAEASMPSGRRRSVGVRWLLRVIADLRNTTTIGATTPDGEVIVIDPFDDPPVPRALPCPYLCPGRPFDSSADASAGCRYAWLHATDASAFLPPDPALGILSRPHSLLLLPWQPPGNPGPPPLSGSWTCRSEAAISAGSAGSGSAVFRVTSVARPNLCGLRMPRRSVVFVARGDSAGGQLGVNCTVCGLDSGVSGELSLLGSVGGVDVAATIGTSALAGGGLELGLRFTRLRLNPGGDGGSVLVRCSATDGRGRGLVAYSTIEALPEPPGVELKVLDDCSEVAPDRLAGAHCGTKFSCPLDPSLAAGIRGLSVSVSYLFTLLGEDGSPPQQVLGTSDRLRIDSRVSRLRCAQLVSYSPDSELGSRSQPFAALDAASAAVFRAALGDNGYARLLLAVQSGWLITQSVTSTKKKLLAAEQSYYSKEGYRQPFNVNYIIGTVICIIILCLIVFLVIQLMRRCRAEAASTAAAAANAAAAAAPGAPASDDAEKKPEKKTENKNGDEDANRKEESPKATHNPVGLATGRRRQLGRGVQLCQLSSSNVYTDTESASGDVESPAIGASAPTVVSWLFSEEAVCDSSRSSGPPDQRRVAPGQQQFFAIRTAEFGATTMALAAAKRTLIASLPIRHRRSDLLHASRPDLRADAEDVYVAEVRNEADSDSMIAAVAAAEIPARLTVDSAAAAPAANSDEDASRVQRCVACRPPRLRLASAMRCGVQLLSTESPSESSELDAEFDMPHSERAPVLLAVPVTPAAVEDDDPEDGTTATGAGTQSDVDKVTGRSNVNNATDWTEISSCGVSDDDDSDAEEESESRMVRRAVRRAIAQMGEWEK